LVLEEYSKISKFEITNTADKRRKEEIRVIFSLSSNFIEVNNRISGRAKEFENAGLQAFDAMHLACAKNRADIFLTVDGDFLRKALKIDGLIIRVSNPLKWLGENLS